MARPALTLVPSLQQPLELETEELVAPPAPATWAAVAAEELPDAQAWATTLAQVVVEALQGRRGVSQLIRWVDERVLAEVTLRVRQRRAAGRSSQPAACVSIRVQHPAPRRAEVTATISYGDNVAAIALRLEGCQQRWLCTALEIGPNPRW